MNFKDTLISAELVLETGEVPLIIGESGIGKTALAKKLANKNNFKLVVIDGNLLKEGEIGGLPTIESYKSIDSNGNFQEKKATIYAVHTKLKEIDEEILNGNKVLLFIDEINRCEHTVQQELMNLILNREINGYKLHNDVKILAAMNPSNKYGEDFDYQVVDMDAAQENRFVWLNMENDYIIITGGTSNMIGLAKLANEVLGPKAEIEAVKLLGIRNNKYSTALGTIIYFANKLKIRGQEYSMISKEEIDDMISNAKSKNINGNVLDKVFNYFFSE